MFRKHRWLDWLGSGHLCALTADAARELDVLGHDRDTLGVDGAQVGVLEQADQVCLSRLLQRQHRAALEAQVGLEVLRDLAHQALERQLADQQLRALLVLADLAQRHRAGAVPAQGSVHDVKATSLPERKTCWQTSHHKLQQESDSIHNGQASQTEAPGFSEQVVYTNNPLC